MEFLLNTKEEQCRMEVYNEYLKKIPQLLTQLETVETMYEKALMELEMLLAGNDFSNSTFLEGGHTLIHTAGLDTGIHNSQAVPFAHHCGQQEQRLPEGQIQGAVGGIHEEIAAALHFRVDTVAGLQLYRAGAAAADFQNQALGDIHRVDDTLIDEHCLFLNSEHLDFDATGHCHFIKE